eukprot:1787594-Rhodomonas_salina.2
MGGRPPATLVDGHPVQDSPQTASTIRFQISRCPRPVGFIAVLLRSLSILKIVTITVSTMSSTVIRWGDLVERWGGYGKQARAFPTLQTCKGPAPHQPSSAEDGLPTGEKHTQDRARFWQGLFEQRNPGWVASRAGAQRRREKMEASQEWMTRDGLGALGTCLPARYAMISTEILLAGTRTRR